MTRRVIQTLAVAAVVTWPEASGASPPKLQIVDDPSLGVFVEIENFSPEVLDLAGDLSAAIGTFGGNFILRPGLVVVGQNGGVAFGQKTVFQLAPLNEAIPSNAAFNGGQATLAYWDDIDDKDGDTLYVELVGDPVLSDRIIIQWTDLNFDGAGSTIKCQVHILFNNAPSGVYAQCMYKIDGSAVSAGDSVTIGYQDGGTGYGDVQFSFDTPDAITSDTVLSMIIPAPGDLDADGEIGIADFLLLLGSWGPCADCLDCPADIDGNCQVGIEDFLYLIGNWG